jgi:ribosomal protein S12 methylthiotransferase accessory factor
MLGVPLTESLTELLTEPLTDPYTGLFTAFGELPSLPHDPSVMLWAASLSPRGPRSEPTEIGGAGLSLERARLACLGEGVERFSGHPLPSDEFVEASHDELAARGVGVDGGVVDPQRWVLFHPHQYASGRVPFEPLARSTRCRFTRFRESCTGRSLLVPEDFAFLYPRAGARHRFAPGISTGLSAGRAGDPVILRGLQELIERDAMVGAWWGRYPLERWDGANVFDALGREVGARFERPNLRYRFHRIRSPLSDHVTLVTLEGDERDGFCFSIGTACRESLAESFEKSLLEAVQGRHFVRHLRRLGRGTREHPRDFVEHALFYSEWPERLDATVLRRPVAAAPPKRSAETLASLATRLGPERPVLVRMMTPPEVSALAPDWIVVRVLVPGLQPLHGQHAAPLLGGPLWGARPISDWQRIPPHPFA